MRYSRRRDTDDHDALAAGPGHRRISQGTQTSGTPQAACTAEQAPRGDRRRLPRAGQRDTGVRVVRIRPRAAPGARQDAAGDREYVVQWWATGRWRGYWCGPGRTRPRGPVDQPYLAGPDGKPVRGTERVQVWDR